MREYTFRFYKDSDKHTAEIIHSATKTFTTTTAEDAYESATTHMKSIGCQHLLLVS